MKPIYPNPYDTAPRWAAVAITLAVIFAFFV